jgi:hypothetical protein
MLLGAIVRGNWGWGRKSNFAINLKSFSNLKIWSQVFHALKLT